MTSDWDDTVQVDDWKAAYGPLIKTTIEGTVHYFRTLTRAEAVELNLVEGFIEPEAEEAVFRRCLLYPSFVDIDALSPGAPTAVCQEILARSGLAGSKWLNEYISRARDRQTAYHTIAATICAAFPTIDPASLDDLHVEALMDLVVQAEEILAIQAKVHAGLYVPLTFEDIGGNGEPQELSNEAKDAMVRAMLEGAMPEGPTGVIDRSKVPPGARHYMDDDDL